MGVVLDHVVTEGTPEELKGELGATDVTLEDVYLNSTGRELELAA